MLQLSAYCTLARVHRSLRSRLLKGLRTRLPKKLLTTLLQSLLNTLVQEVIDIVYTDDDERGRITTAQKSLTLTYAPYERAYLEPWGKISPDAPTDPCLLMRDEKVEAQHEQGTTFLSRKNCSCSSYLWRFVLCREQI